MGKDVWGYVICEETELELHLENATQDDLKAFKTWK